MHVTLTDHHPRISPLPSTLAPHLQQQPQPTSRSGGSREGAQLLQTQLQMQMQPKREQQ